VLIARLVEHWKQRKCIKVEVGLRRALSRLCYFAQRDLKETASVCLSSLQLPGDAAMLNGKYSGPRLDVSISLFFTVIARHLFFDSLCLGCKKDRF
jgi:hypothetical protein